VSKLVRIHLRHFVLGIAIIVMQFFGVAKAELWTTYKASTVWDNWGDWHLNQGPFATLEDHLAAAIEWCKANADYINPATDCQQKPFPAGEVSGPYTDTNGPYYSASVELSRNNGFSGTLPVRWYKTRDSACGFGKLVDPETEYNCIDPGFRAAPNVESPLECNESNPCNPANGNKSQREVDYAGFGDGSPNFVRYYNSQGEYKTADNMAAGWRHTYSRGIDQPPDRLPTVRVAAPPSTSSFYPTAAEACTDGWDEIKASVWSGDLSGASAVFVGGNRCEISSGAPKVANFSVRSGPAAWASFLPPPNTKTLIRKDGSAVYFDFDGADWVNELDPSMRVEASGSNWIFTDTNDTQETYDSSGKLTAITYRNGQSETLEYDLTVVQGGDGDNDTLDRVTGEFGHQLTFTYDASNRLATVVTPDGNVQYTYGDFENIETVTYSDASTRQYHYEDDVWTNHLTGITDENLDRFATWAYDTEGRAISSEHAGGKERVEFTYNVDGTTTLTTANNATRTYIYSTQQGERKLAMLTGDVCGTCPRGEIADRTYDSNGFLDSVFDWNGNETQTIRNSVGLTTSLIEGKGSPEERTTTTTWHPTFRIPTKIVSPKNATDFTYDADRKSHV